MTKLDCMYLISNRPSDPIILVLYGLQIEHAYSKEGRRAAREPPRAAPRRELRSLNLKPGPCTDLTAYHDPASAS
jgi:hypothetical protein